MVVMQFTKQSEPVNSQAKGTQGTELQKEKLEAVTENTESSEMVLDIQDTEDMQQSETIQVVMVGDMLMHTRIIDSGLKNDGTYNFDHLFMHVKEFIDEADMAIVNQETILGGEELGYSGYPRFNSPYALGDAEVKAGFNVILHATNHTLDKGREGVLNCMDFWETTYPEIACLGINESQEEQDNEIYVYEQAGMKIAVLNYTYGTNGLETPSNMPYLVNYMEKEKIIADIQKAESIADFTIVCPHWGTEYSLGVSSEQEYWTSIFLEYGVDLVIGAHPHVIEPIKWITHENGHQMLVYYSLGNFVNGTSSTGSGVTNRMVGGIADVTIGRNESSEVAILEHDVVPIVCHIGEEDAYTVYYLEDYTEELAKENKILSQDSEFSKALCDSIVESVWGEEN
ncbi:MAG: CapA family protein [Lachnospiraceae bacterium]|nr:CapA family protein [Lachnospiraceae bacterium]